MRIELLVLLRHCSYSYAPSPLLYSPPLDYIYSPPFNLISHHATCLTDAKLRIFEITPLFFSWQARCAQSSVWCGQRQLSKYLLTPSPTLPTAHVYINHSPLFHSSISLISLIVYTCIQNIEINLAKLVYAVARIGHLWPIYLDNWFIV